MTRRQRSRWLPLVLVAAALLSGCTELSTSGVGTVTVRSETAATTYDPTTNRGIVAFVCEAGATLCQDDVPYLYKYYPNTGEREWIVSPGFPVFDAAGIPTSLPPGEYTLVGTDYRGAGRRFTNLVTLDIFATSEKDLTLWHQSHQRGSSSSTCRYGWEPGWAQWPNNGTGGFVCNRQIYAYYPDEPVPIPGYQQSEEPWLQSVARQSASDACPDGYAEGWAQWPNRGSGGFVCNRVVL